MLSSCQDEEKFVHFKESGYFEYDNQPFRPVRAVIGCDPIRASYIDSSQIHNDRVSVFMVDCRNYKHISIAVDNIGDRRIIPIPDSCLVFQFGKPEFDTTGNVLLYQGISGEIVIEEFVRSVFHPTNARDGRIILNFQGEVYCEENQDTISITNGIARLIVDY